MENVMKVGYTFSLTQDESLLRKGEKVFIKQVQPKPYGAWVEIESVERPTYIAWLLVKTGEEQETFGQEKKAGR